MEMKQSFTIWIAIVWIEDVVQCIELEIMVQLEHDRIWRGENAQYVLTLRRHLCQHCISQTQHRRDCQCHRVLCGWWLVLPWLHVGGLPYWPPHLQMFQQYLLAMRFNIDTALKHQPNRWENSSFMAHVAILKNPGLFLLSDDMYGLWCPTKSTAIHLSS